MRRGPRVGAMAALAIGCASAVLFAVAIGGCSKRRPHKSVPTQPAPPAVPLATTPEEAVRLIEWSWNNRSVPGLRTVLSNDFAFGCAPADTAGNHYPGHALMRADELTSAQHLFVDGTVSELPASHITVTFDPNLVPVQDGRPGKQDMTYHLEIVTSIVVAIDTDIEAFRLTGSARFHVVRGDSAIIPADLAAAGVIPDAHRWYVDLWEDESGGPRPGLAAMPARSATLCQVMALYR
jgi:hypothetical protein